MTQAMWVRMNELYEIVNSYGLCYRSASAIQKAVPAYEVNPLQAPRPSHRLMWQWL